MAPFNTPAYQRDLVAYEALGGARELVRMHRAGLISADRLAELLTASIDRADAKLAALDADQKVAA